MYPNLYYVFKDWFGVSWKPMSYLNTFGFMVAMAFIVAAVILSAELRRKEKQALLLPREETITVGSPASFWELLVNFLTGFLFGYKLLGLLFDKPDEMNPQEYIFSSHGSWLAGILLGLVLAGWKWMEKRRQQTPAPEQRSIRIWPHDRVGDIIVIGLIAGIIGAKLFDSFENWDDFVNDPWGRLLSAGGLTYYGGLILASIAILLYAYRKNIRLIHLVDAAAPALLLAYAVGRIGCQVSGDGDWGIYNSAYITTPEGKVVAAGADGYEAQIRKYNTYFLNGEVKDSGMQAFTRVTDRKWDILANVPHASITAPSWLPVWMVAYSYPQNVNNDGFRLEHIKEDHNRALPVPVFPTPFYETIACTLLFLVLWAIRKKVKTPGIITGIYLIMNGAERFMVETIRVNNQIHFLGMNVTQAELIACSLVLAGIGFLLYFSTRKTSTQ